MDELISAVKGGGAHLNGTRVTVGQATCVREALVCNNVGASRKPEVNRLATERLHALLQENVRGLRNSGSAAQNMMHVACGALDAYFEVRGACSVPNRCHLQSPSSCLTCSWSQDGFGGPWDVAAGKIIVEEAGGVYRSHLGGPFVLKAGKGQVLAGNSAVVEDVARILRSVEPASSE